MASWGGSGIWGAVGIRKVGGGMIAYRRGGGGGLFI